MSWINSGRRSRSQSKWPSAAGRKTTKRLTLRWKTKRTENLTTSNAETLYSHGSVRAVTDCSVEGHRPVGWKAILIIILATWIVWFPTLGAGFASDDWWMLYVILNRDMFWRLLQPWAWGVWRPLSHHLYFDLLYSLFGLNPLPFHILNLSLHTLNALLVGWIWLKLSGERYGAMTAGLFYSLHLAHLDTRMWVFGNTDIMSTLGFLGAFGSYLQFRTAGRSRRWWMIAAVLSFIGAMVSKENVIVLPVVLLLYDLVFHPSSSGRPLTRLQQYWSVLPFFLIAAVFGIFHLFFSPAAEPGHHFRLDWSSLFLFGRYVWWQITLKFQQFNEVSTAQEVVGLITLVLVSLLAIRSQRRVLVFATGCWFLTHFPYIFMPGHVNPHYVMMSLFGLSGIVGWIAAWMYSTCVPLLGPRLIAAGASVAVILWTSVTMSAAAYRAESHWQTSRWRFAQCTIRYVRERYPLLSPDAKIYFLDFTKDQKWAIFGGSALNVFYASPSIHSAFVPDPDPTIFTWEYNIQALQVPPDAKYIVTSWQVADRCFESSKRRVQPMSGADATPLGSYTPALSKEPHPEVPLRLNFGDYVEFLGYDLVREDSKPLMTCYWRTITPTHTPYKVFVHFGRGPHQMWVFGHEYWPIYDNFPTTRWRPGEIYRETYRIPMPQAFGPGNYTIGIGLYAPSLPPEDPEHRLHIRASDQDVQVVEGGTKALIGYLGID